MILFVCLFVCLFTYAQYSYDANEHMLNVRLTVEWNDDRVFDDIYGFDGELLFIQTKYGFCPLQRFCLVSVSSGSQSPYISICIYFQLVFATDSVDFSGFKKLKTKQNPSVLFCYYCKVKMQYVQISNVIDTSIKHQMSGQSTLMVKGCMDIMFDIHLQLLKSIDHLLISGIFQGKRKQFVCNLKCTHLVFTSWGRCKGV